MEEFDCVVIGAGMSSLVPLRGTKGWYGIAAAKQFHCTQPGARLAVFDSQSSIGGTWADERLYPGLRSNNLVGTYEFPDFPMDEASFGVAPGRYIPGAVVNRYLKAYAVHFGVDPFVRLGTKVVRADYLDEHEGGGWRLAVSPGSGRNYEVRARRLIMATGLTSEAFLPHFQGQEEYGGRIFHSKHFLQNKDTLETARRVTVFGATKFAYDAVFAYTQAGVEVDWIIRYTRMLSWLSPCIWGDSDGYGAVRRFLHGTAVGRFITDTYWKILSSDTLALCGFDKHPETAKLKPWIPAMWVGTSFSIFNYEMDFLELVRKGDLVKVHVGEIDHLSPGKVHLADGTELESDALVANTGWKHVPPIAFGGAGSLEAQLGMPHQPVAREEAPAQSGGDDHDHDSDLASRWDLIDRADEEILSRFPRLRDQPVWNKGYVPLTAQKGIDSGGDEAGDPCRPRTPWMLHRFMVPAHPKFLARRDVAFVGVVANFSNTLTAHLQGLWVSAYFQGRLVRERDPAARVAASGSGSAELERLRYETVLVNRFGRWRYPTDWGSKAPSFIFDAVPYLDQLQLDLGLEPHRKKGFLAEWYSPYRAGDYRTVTEEWMAKQG
ncbi:uncharacterized protein E0L32_010985 [Thyridium curvatum]|uniref:L-ornithine N(5)-monooxygenase [NAD(P)H] n=1 Tax=Thyridium curvatum TaxID=1093900 RepID=A0A507ASA4_9PEZI|nr:uncharacterized protein E0L32_010985 [Thyridium curvatum]TPX07090.1 hypothetical protein E0L32_010985 [Thyridium curvatum]